MNGPSYSQAQMDLNCMIARHNGRVGGWFSGMVNGVLTTLLIQAAGYGIYRWFW